MTKRKSSSSASAGRIRCGIQEPKDEILYPEDFIYVVDDKRLISNSGLGFVGRLLTHADMRKELNRLGHPKNLKHGNYECIVSLLALLCQGKTAYEDVREMQEDPSYYCRALKINSIPSPETVRQRCDILAKPLYESDLIEQANIRMLQGASAPVNPSRTGHFPLDIDVTVHDNSNTKKEGVSWTYQGIDGYAPIYAYLGREGYLVSAQLRKGSDHSQNAKTPDFLRSAIKNAKQIVEGPILVRMDSGNDAKINMVVCDEEKVDFLIKRNLRSEKPGEWLSIAKEGDAAPYSPREGKTVYTCSSYRDLGLGKAVRIVVCATERTMSSKGQILLVPEIEVDTWWTSLVEENEETIIELYHEHAICEQFHSEIKSDIGLERFPSGYFETNGAILNIAMLAYNMLRVIGQKSIIPGEKAPRSGVLRIRAKTVMQRLMYIAGNVTSHARRHFVSLGRSNLWRDAFLSVYAALI